MNNTIDSIKCPCGTIHPIFRPYESEHFACAESRVVFEKTGDSWQTAGKLHQIPSALLEIGSTGHLRGKRRTVVGFLERLDPDSETTWCEYLVLSDDDQADWLMEQDGHWSLLTESKTRPKPAGTATFMYLSRRYSLYHKGRAVVKTYAGEIPWAVREGEISQVTDYISPPYLLNMDRAGGDEVWFSGVYLQSSDVKKAFGIKRMPAEVGLPPGQELEENPKAKASVFISSTLAFAAITIITACFQWMSPQHRLLNGTLRASQTGDSEMTSEPFSLEGTGNLEIVFSSDVSNNWVYVDAELINEQSGESRAAGVNLEHYSGVDEDGSWAEGSQSGSRVIPNVTAGKYRIVVSSHATPGSGMANVSYTVNRNSSTLGNLFIALCILGALPAFLLYRSYSLSEQNTPGRAGKRN